MPTANSNITTIVDDLKKNIVAAAELGFQTYHLSHGEEVSDVFQ